MRARVSTAFAAAALAFILSDGAPVRAEDAPAEGEAAPADPTRGQWDAFLDPVRDAEDRVVEGEKWIEDRTKIHVGPG